jgi:hypothetical protein
MECKMYYTMADAKRDFSLGYLDQFVIERKVLGKGWYVKLGPPRNQVLHPLVDARSKQWRLFKTLDAAVSAVEDVGFEVNLLG